MIRLRSSKPTSTQPFKGFAGGTNGFVSTVKDTVSTGESLASHGRCSVNLRQHLGDNIADECFVDLHVSCHSWLVVMNGLRGKSQRPVKDNRQSASSRCIHSRGSTWTVSTIPMIKVSMGMFLVSGVSRALDPWRSERNLLRQPLTYRPRQTCGPSSPDVALFDVQPVGFDHQQLIADHRSTFCVATSEPVTLATNMPLSLQVIA